jgi:hypothetical protein
MGSMQHAWDRREMNAKFWSKIKKGRNHLDDLRVDGRIILNLIIR